jgi:hypothetical protein
MHPHALLLTAARVVMEEEEEEEREEQEQGGGRRGSGVAEGLASCRLEDQPGRSPGRPGRQTKQQAYARHAPMLELRSA